MAQKITPAFADPKGAILDSNINLGYPLIVERSTTPAGASPAQTTAAGYAKGCLWINSAGSAGSILYMNQGTTAAASWLNIG